MGVGWVIGAGDRLGVWEGTGVEVGSDYLIKIAFIYGSELSDMCIVSHI